jgi:peptide/nickel transport system ATP-binding protein
MDNNTLLDVSDLRVYFHSMRGEYKVVDGVNLTVQRQEILGLAGESGCGKSTVVEAIMRLIRPPGYIESGEIMFYPAPEENANADDPVRATDDKSMESRFMPSVDLLKLEEQALRELRWKYISYVPQASMNSLNPVMRIEAQMLDVILAHSGYSKAEARERAANALALVGLPQAVLQAYPHELSGGMKQRAIIAIAMTLSPQLVIADEPTTALDVNVQRAVLESILEIKEQSRATIIFVSHDLAVHAELVDRLAIMYAGKIVEVETVRNLYKNPLHPYSQRLISSIPVLGGARVRQEAILGQSPDRLTWPTGCRFHPRCPFAMEQCKQIEPPLIEVEAGHWVACHLYPETTTAQAVTVSQKVDHVNS